MLAGTRHAAQVTFATYTCIATAVFQNCKEEKLLQRTISQSACCTNIVGSSKPNPAATYFYCNVLVATLLTPTLIAQPAEYGRLHC